jgi:hypothetical protein
MLVRKRYTGGRQSIAMLPNWIIVLSAIELVGFLVFALSIITAAPEEAFFRVSRESAPKNARQPRLS